MSIQSIVQIAEQTNIGKIDGILQMARCVKNLYDKVNEKGNRKKFEKAALKHLKLKVFQTFVYLKINKNEEKLRNHKSYLPVNIHCLDAIASMTEEEITNGIEMNLINTSKTIKQLREYQHTLPSYLKRNRTHIGNRVNNNPEKERIHKEAQERIKENNKKFSLANKIEKESVEELNVKIKHLEDGFSNAMNKIYLLQKKNEELNNRVDLIQMLLKKM